ncbi:hypothetical protein GGR42_000994 [Saonia flava]|uniref:Uncharacterized protein n=1 Tax=Saonia flava TaxID=523696 RepID=A0A846QVD2_9FLAO|nr:hypothetical protein [Saonia flava]NJB70532.1 hypothetical protein [Saonia flava]
MKPCAYIEFKKTLTENEPPSSWSNALKCCWYDANGNWEAAHNIAQDMHNSLGSWLHAYLHRKEGDEWNAGYWYRQAGKPFPQLSLEEELKEIVLFEIKKA